MHLYVLVACNGTKLEAEDAYLSFLFLVPCVHVGKRSRSSASACGPRHVQAADSRPSQTNESITELVSAQPTDRGGRAGPLGAGRA